MAKNYGRLFQVGVDFLPKTRSLPSFALGRVYWGLHMRKLLFTIGLTLVALPMMAMGGPSSGPVLVKELRAYWSGGYYIDVDSSELCGTDAFVVNSDNLGNKIMYAALLSALLSEKYVKLEAVECTGWGSPLMGVTILAD
jgi:hypothetical protein